MIKVDSPHALTDLIVLQPFNNRPVNQNAALAAFRNAAVLRVPQLLAGTFSFLRRRAHDQTPRPIRPDKSSPCAGDEPCDADR